MKKTIFTTLLVLITFTTIAQQLTVNETIDYINKTLKDNPHGNSHFVLNLSSEGYLEISRQFNNYDKYLIKCKMHFSEVRASRWENDIRLVCKSDVQYAPPTSCFTCSGPQNNPIEGIFDIYNKDKYIGDKLYNSFSYLLTKIKESDRYSRNDDDPFAPQNFDKNSNSISNSTTSDVLSQCNCESINRGDGIKIVQCNAMPLAYDNNTQVGVACASNGQDKFLNVVIRFKSTAQNISGNLTIRLENNSMMSFSLVKAQLTYIGNSQVANAVFLTNSADVAKLKKSKIKTITFKLKDQLTRTYQATSNSDVLVNQLQCL